MFEGNSINNCVFNQDISGWDTSAATLMTGMFHDNFVFNQDLSGWCVNNISSEPDEFDDGASGWTLPNSRPNWGASCT